MEPAETVDVKNLLEDDEDLSDYSSEDSGDEDSSPPATTGPKSVKILWVYTSIGLPINGLAVYQGQRVWFRFQGPPPSRNAPITNIKYEILQIDAEAADSLQTMYQAYSAATGAPQHHGAPRIIKRTVKKDKDPNFAANNSGAEFKFSTMVRQEEYNHSFNPENVTGPILTVVTKDDFENLFVPHLVEFQDVVTE